MFENEEIDEMLEYIEAYADSVESPDENDKKSKYARELLKYLSNNRQGLLPYDKQGKNIPVPQKGLIYKHMGVQGNQNCTVITMRMKHRRMRWSKSGANNLAKALFRRKNKELINTIDQYTDGLIFNMQIREVIETLSAAKTPKKDGKGNPYTETIKAHMP